MKSLMKNPCPSVMWVILAVAHIRTSTSHIRIGSNKDMSSHGKDASHRDERLPPFRNSYVDNKCNVNTDELQSELVLTPK